MFKYSANKCNKELVQQLVQGSILKTKECIDAMIRTDRKFYCPHYPYVDNPQSIGYGATISAPHMHAYALQFLFKQLKTAKKVLDVGSGTGYLTAAMALLVPQNCKVYGIDHVPQLVAKSIQNIEADNSQLLKSGKVQLKAGDGRKGWIWQEGVKFDVIHVGAAPQKIPQALIQQLADGGRMVIPVGKEHGHQQFLAVDKVGDTIKKEVVTGVRYVPLTDLQYQLKHS